MRLIAVSPAPEEGVGCPTSEPECGVAQNAAILLRFDRYLLPSTAIRQSIRVFSGSEDVGTSLLKPEYDLLERVLIFRQSGLLQAGALYTIEVVVPKAAGDFGLRAFDGAPLAEGDVPLRFDFRVRQAPPPSAGDEPPRDPVPASPLASFTSCLGGSCHSQGENGPRMGLDLSSREGVLGTAISKVARNAETGSKTGLPLENAPRLGVGMPIIDPSRPDNSFLVYKLLRRPENLDDGSCSTRYPSLGVEANCTATRVREGERLREWFVRGEGMPALKYLPLSGGGVEVQDPALSPETTRGIQAWIRAGAPL